MPTATHVAGFCPACGRESLAVMAEGHITCGHLECPDPTQASRALHTRQAAARDQARAWRAQSSEAVNILLTRVAIPSGVLADFAAVWDRPTTEWIAEHAKTVSPPGDAPAATLARLVDTVIEETTSLPAVRDRILASIPTPSSPEVIRVRAQVHIGRFRRGLAEAAGDALAVECPDCLATVSQPCLPDEPAHLGG